MQKKRLEELTPQELEAFVAFVENTPKSEIKKFEQWVEGIAEARWLQIKAVMDQFPSEDLAKIIAKVSPEDLESLVDSMIQSQGSQSPTEIVTETLQKASAGEDVSSLSFNRKGINAALLGELLQGLAAYEVKSLTLNNDVLGKEAGHYLNAFVSGNAVLCTLNLENSYLYDAGVAALMDGLSHNASVRSANLQCNHIGGEGGRTIGAMLAENETLETLDLEFNPLWEKGVIAIGEALSCNTGLRTLNLRQTNMSAQAAKALAVSLKQNHTLEVLDISRNPISTDGAFYVAEALKVNTGLITLRIGEGDPNIGPEGVKALAEALKVNTHLQNLNLENSYLGEDGAFAMAEMLENNATLTSLSLRADSALGNSKDALKAAILNNKNLIELEGYEDVDILHHVAQNLFVAYRIADFLRQPGASPDPEMLETLAERRGAVTTVLRDMGEDVSLAQLGSWQQGEAVRQANRSQAAR